MIRSALLLIAIAAIYVAVTRKPRGGEPSAEHDADAQWANEGGANAPTSV
jgi:hypothetical protein